jgi:hypothetical protein
MDNNTLNVTSISSLNETVANLPSIDQLLLQLGFETWQTTIKTFVLTPINLIALGFCSFSLWIFYRSSFVDQIFFYYRLLCFIYILKLIHNIPFGILFSPFYFPWVNTYGINVYRIYYTFVSSLFFHYENAIQMGILLHKMKLFSPFVRKHFTATPHVVSCSLLLTCLFIDLPLLFAFKIVPLGSYYYIDSSGVKHKCTLYFLESSEFSLTVFGKILLGLTAFFLNFFLSLCVGVKLNIISYIKYKSHVRKRHQEVEELQISSFNNRPTISREIEQINQREKFERNIERNMFYMALTLCSFSILSRFIFMTCFIYYFNYDSFSNSLVMGQISSFIFTLGPTISTFVFYYFNKMFREETNKRVFRREARQNARVLFYSQENRAEIVIRRHFLNKKDYDNFENA